MDKRIKTIFFGTPDFALPALNELIVDKNFNVVAVVTQPDKRVGREQKINQSPIKILAIEKKIAVLQPDKIDNTFVKSIENLGAELFVVVAYGFILPKEVIDIPRLGAVNLHASLLPKYRGASPIQSAIMAGDKVTGNTVMLMDVKMDHGPILAQEEIKIDYNETGQSLHDKLSKAGSKLLISILGQLINGTVELQEQKNEEATYCQLINRQDGKIDWSKPVIEIERRIRAFYPWPATFTFFNKKRLKIISAKILHADSPAKKDEAGRAFITSDNMLGVTCGKGTLIIHELQPAGSKKMTSQEFIAGHRDINDKKLS